MVYLKTKKALAKNTYFACLPTCQFKAKCTVKENKEDSGNNLLC